MKECRIRFRLSAVGLPLESNHLHASKPTATAGVFVDCRFLTKAAHADVCFIYGKNATDVERSLLLVRPIFWNCVLAVADPANAVNFGAAQTDGDVLMIDPTGINISILGGASLNIYVQGAVPTEATTGKAVEIVT